MADYDLKLISLLVDTDNNKFYKSNGDRWTSPRYPFVNSGDKVLIAVQFQRRDPVTRVLANMDLTGMQELICTVCDARRTGATVITQQTLFNQGEMPNYEDLATGKVTWLVDFASQDLDGLLDAADRVNLWMEFASLSSAATDQPQTLWQGILHAYAQLDVNVGD